MSPAAWIAVGCMALCIAELLVIAWLRDELESERVEVGRLRCILNSIGRARAPQRRPSA